MNKPGYQLFFERACRLLRSRTGVLALITSNSWLRAKYGEPLRRYLADKHTPLRLIDMGKDVFDAIVDASILVLREGGPNGTFPAVDTDRTPAVGFPPTSKYWGHVRPKETTPWSILSDIEQSVLDKMHAVGTPLRDWDISIYRGILTGYNAAFLIDGATRDELISEDPRSAEILKPILRGRDIGRYRAEWADLWLIATHNGYGDVPAVQVNDYPAIKRHLDRFYVQLAKRHDKGHTPYNLRNCAYHHEFAKEKIVWIELVERGRFAYDESGMLGEATTFLATGPHVKFLCAVLNSRLVHWYVRMTAPTSGMGTLRWKKIYVERVPIPRLPPVEQRAILRLVDRILSSRSAAPSDNVSVLEEEIDRMIYGLYGLTRQEVVALEAGPAI